MKFIAFTIRTPRPGKILLTILKTKIQDFFLHSHLAYFNAQTGKFLKTKFSLHQKICMVKTCFSLTFTFSKNIGFPKSNCIYIFKHSPSKHQYF